MTLPDEPKNFWHTMFPAAPGTYVLRKNAKATDGYTKLPVIAWAPDASNAYKEPHPITVRGLVRLIPGAILHPCGMVTDPDQITAFADVEEWLASDGTRDTGDEDEPTPRPRATPSTQSGEGVLPSSEPEVEIEWTTSPFKTNSFYRYTDEDADLDFLFSVEPGINPPKQKGHVSKIKRDEFMSLKKTMDVREVEDLMEGNLGAPEEEDEDDGASLI